MGNVLGSCHCSCNHLKRIESEVEVPSRNMFSMNGFSNMTSGEANTKISKCVDYFMGDEFNAILAKKKFESRHVFQCVDSFIKKIEDLKDLFFLLKTLYQQICKCTNNDFYKYSIKKNIVDMESINFSNYANNKSDIRGYFIDVVSINIAVYHRYNCLLLNKSSPGDNYEEIQNSIFECEKKLIQLNMTLRNKKTQNWKTNNNKVFAMREFLKNIVEKNDKNLKY